MSFLLVWINLFIWFRLRSSSHYEEWINRQVILTATSNTDLFHLKIACKRIFLTPRCEETIKAFLTVATVIANIVLLVISFLSSQTLSCHVISILGLITNIVLVRPLVEDAVQGGLEHSGLPPRRHQCQELEGRAPAGLNDFSKDRQPELSFLVWCSEHRVPQLCDGTPSPIQSQSDILKDLVLLKIVFSRLQSKTTLEKKSWPPRHRLQRRLRKSRTLLRLDSNIVISSSMPLTS